MCTIHPRLILIVPVFLALLAGTAAAQGGTGKIVDLPLDKAWTLSGASNRDGGAINLGTYGKAVRDRILRQVSEVRVTASTTFKDRGLTFRFYYDDTASESVFMNMKEQNKLLPLVVKPVRWKGRRLVRLEFTHGTSGVWMSVVSLKMVDRGPVKLIDPEAMGGTRLNPKGMLRDGVLLLPQAHREDKWAELTNLVSRRYRFTVGRSYYAKLPATNTLRFRIFPKAGGEKLVDIEVGHDVATQTVDFGMEPAKIARVLMQGSGTGIILGVRGIEPEREGGPSAGYAGLWQVTRKMVKGPRAGYMRVLQLRVNPGRGGSFNLSWSELGMDLPIKEAVGFLEGGVLAYKAKTGGAEAGRLVIDPTGRVMGGVFTVGQAGQATVGTVEGLRRMQKK